VFKDRKEAGKILAEKLQAYTGKDTIILGIPRGGVVVADQVAKILNLRLDVLVIKKLGYPGDEEFAIGATSADTYALNENARGVPKEYIAKEVKRRQQEAQQRYLLLKGTQKMPRLNDKVVILIDDGIATGATMGLAIEIIKKQKPKKVVVAIPVAPPEAFRKLKAIADEVICPLIPESFMAIGEFYERFDQVQDDEVKEILKRYGK